MICKQKGMTLAEVLVAITIFSLIMLATLTALRTFAFTYERLIAVTSTITEMREVDRFLRQALRNAVNEAQLFEGERSSLRWVGPIDRVGGAGGLQHLRLTHKNDNLILSFAPFTPADTSPDWAVQVPDFSLIQQAETVNFFYQANPTDNWEEKFQWKNQEGDVNLPWAVAIEIISAGDTWPPLIINFDRYRFR